MKNLIVIVLCLLAIILILASSNCANAQQFGNYTETQYQQLCDLSQELIAGNNGKGISKLDKIVKLSGGEIQTITITFEKGSSYIIGNKTNICEVSIINDSYEFVSNGKVVINTTKPITLKIQVKNLSKRKDYMIINVIFCGKLKQ